MSYYVEPHHYETAENNGISKLQVDNRVYRNAWTVERAITQPLRKRSDHDWSKWKDVAKVKKSTYMQRVRVMGWEQVAAALTPIIGKNDKRRVRSECKNTSSTNHI